MVLARVSLLVPAFQLSTYVASNMMPVRGGDL